APRPTAAPSRRRRGPRRKEHKATSCARSSPTPFRKRRASGAPEGGPARGRRYFLFLLRALDRLFAPAALREPRAPFRRRLVAEVRARLTRPLGVRRGFVSPRMGSTSGSLSI